MEHLHFNFLFTGNSAYSFLGWCLGTQKSREGNMSGCDVPRGALPCEAAFASCSAPALLPVLAAKAACPLGWSSELLELQGVLSADSSMPG